MTSSPEDLELVSVTKRYGDTIAVDAVEPPLPRGRLHMPFGPIWLWKIIDAPHDRRP